MGSISTANGPVQSIDRVLDIMETLSGVPQGMSLSDLSAATGLHISTAYRLVSSLTERGYARKDSGSGKYRLTLRMFEIGSQVSGVLNLLSAAQPILDELAVSCHEAVHLVERDGSDVVYLYKAEPSQQLVRMSSCVGRRNPMYCTGVGKSILSFLPPEEVAALWQASEIRPYTEKTVTSLSVMQRQLEEIRQRGYALDDEEHEPGVRCVAAAIQNWKGAPVAAVSISAPAFRLDDSVVSRVLPELLHTTHEISRLLGAVI